MTTLKPADGLTDRRVLIIGDEYFVSDNIAQSLQQLGANVIGPVPDQDQALALLALETFDAAILDTEPEGILALAIVRALQIQGTPFVFATESGQGAGPAQYRNLPCWKKPCDSAGLVRALLELVHQ